MDRSTKATLSTYSTWIQLSRLQNIYHFQSLKLRLIFDKTSILFFWSDAQSLAALPINKSARATQPLEKIL